MNKSNYFFGQTVLGQVLKLIPNSLIRKVVKQNGSDFAVKKFDTKSHKLFLVFRLRTQDKKKSLTSRRMPTSPGLSGAQSIYHSDYSLGDF